MKKLKKNQLKLDKEVITSLSESDLFSVKGGGVISVMCITVNTCPVLYTKGHNENTCECKPLPKYTEESPCILPQVSDCPTSCEIKPIPTRGNC